MLIKEETYTYIIWDFNGTLVDDVQCGIDSVNQMLEKRNLPLLNSREAYQKIFRFPIRDYYKDLGFDFEKEPYEQLAVEWVELYQSCIPDMKLYPGVKTLLAEIRTKYPAISQILLSSSETQMLLHQLEIFGIHSCFDRVYGTDNIYAKGKADLVQAWTRQQTHGRVLFIGDTAHDYEVSRIIADADCLLYTQGHGSRISLQACGVPLIDDLRQVLHYLSGSIMN